MNIWRFGPLKSRQDVRNRFLLRLLWCLVGLAICLPFFKHLRNDVWAIAIMIGIVPLMGAAADAYRLKHPAVTAGRLQLVVLCVVATLFAAYAIVRFVGLG